jgi:hypothetical protein
VEKLFASARTNPKRFRDEKYVAEFARIQTFEHLI